MVLGRVDSGDESSGVSFLMDIVGVGGGGWLV